MPRAKTHPCLPPAPAELKVIEEARALLAAHADDGPMPLYPDVKARLEALASFSDARVPYGTDRALHRVMLKAQAHGIEAVAKGTRASLSPRTPSYYPTHLELAYLERLAESPSEVGAPRAALLLVAAQGQVSALLSTVKASLARSMLRALRQGHPLKDVLSVEASALWKELGRLGRQPPPDPSHDEILEAIKAASTPWRKKLCEALRLRLIVGLTSEQAGEAAGVQRVLVNVAVSKARSRGALWVAQHGLSRPAKYAHRSVGRQVAQRERVTQIHAELTRHHNRPPTARELMKAADHSCVQVARQAAKRYSLPLSQERHTAADTNTQGADT